MSKVVSSLIGVCLTVGAFGQQQGYLGTKTGGSVTAAGTGASGPGIGAFIQMLVALAVVLILLKAVLPRVIGKLNKRLVTNATSTLTIEETASFAGGNLYIVRARSKTLLLSAATTGVTCLADLSEDSTAYAAPTFEEIVTAAPGAAPEFAERLADFEAAPPAPHRSKRTKSSEGDHAGGNEIEIALKRIERLAK